MAGGPILHDSFFDRLLDGATLIQRWHEAGIAVLSLAPCKLHAAVHYGILADDTNVAIQVINEILV